MVKRRISRATPVPSDVKPTPTFMISMGDNIPDSDGSTVSQLLHSLREQIAFIMFVHCLPALTIQLIPRRPAQTVWSDSRGGPRLIDSHSSQLTHSQAREFEKGISDVLVHAKYLVNSFHVTVRVPPEILTTICSHPTTGEDVFSACRICNHWRSVLTSSPSLWT